MVWTGATLRFHTIRVCRRASIDAHNKTIVSAAPIFTNVVSAQHHYMKISYTKFHPNQTRNVENKAEIILCPSVKYRLQCADFQGTRNGSTVLLFLVLDLKERILTITL